MDYLKTVEKIVQSILIEIKDSINSKAEYDKTFVAKISGTINEETYSVLYCGKTYKVSSTIYCDTGDYVRVCAPCNNWSKLYVVENKTKRKTLQDQRLSFKTITCNLVPPMVDIKYSYQNDVLKNRDFIVAYISASIGAVFVPANQFARSVLHVKPEDTWGGEVCVNYDANTGTVSYVVIWMGSSQTLKDFELNTIKYY